MNILLISSEFPPQPGGIGNQAYNLARVLTSAGYTVTVLTNSRGNTLSEEQQFDAALPCRMHRIPRYRFVIRTYFRRWFVLLTLLFQCTPCTVIASGKFSLWMGALSKPFFRKNRYLGIIHGSEISPPGFLPRWLTRNSMASFHQLIAVSHFTRQRVLKVAPRASVTVVHNGFDPFKFPQKPAKPVRENPDHAPVFPALLTIGQISQRKGQHQVVRALTHIRQTYPGVRYHMVGLPSERSKVEQLAKTLSVEDLLEFHGALDDDATADLMQASDVFLMLSQNTIDGDVEGFGIAILEANAAGLPAIGAMGCGIEDAIHDGFSGRLVNAQDPKAVSAALQDIVQNYAAYSANARVWAKAFTWEHKAVEYLRLLS